MPTDFTSRSREDGAAEVVEPVLDGQGQFDVTDGSFRIVFNRPMQRPAPSAPSAAKDGSYVDAAPGTLRITPPVPGTARWVNATTLEFVAAKPMSLGSAYVVELGDVKTLGGEPLEQGFRATFVSRATVAGKILSYVPQAGDPRVVVIHPWDTTTVGRTPELSVLFDQPTPLAVAKSLIRLKDKAGHVIPIAVDHLKSPTYDGVKVDRGHVVLVRPRVQLTRGSDYSLEVAERFDQAETRTKRSSISVASAFDLTEVECGYGHGGACSWSDGRLRAVGTSIEVQFNHKVGTAASKLRNHVSVAPAVRNLNLSTYGWEEGRLVLTGAFEPSKTYQVAISGLTDEFGEKLAKPVSFEVEMAPTGASVTMPEGVLMLDEATSKRFTITSRNVSEAKLLLWPVAKGDAAALERALEAVRAHDVPKDAPPISIDVPMKPERDKNVTATVDLLARLSEGTSYVASVAVGKPAFGAEESDFPRGSEASRPPVALLTPGGPKALAVHARSVPGATLVHVARLSSGQPVAGATLSLLGEAPPPDVTTDANGVALIPGDRDGLLRVRAGAPSQDAAELVMSLDRADAAAKDLFPALTSGLEASASDLRAMVITDRGIYRPGSTAWIKATVRKPDGDRLVPVASSQVRVRVLGPTGDEALSETLATSATGSVATKFAVPAGAKLGRHQIVVEELNHADPPLARSIIQVAEFEPPRFMVDVDAAAGDAGAPLKTGARAGAKASAEAGRLRANIRARYLFGAPMEGASLEWTLRREPASLPAGALTDLGFVFRKQSDAWYEEEREPPWSRAGQATLGKDGVFKLEQPLSMQGAVGPQQFIIEADVSDSSNRHVAGRGSVTIHPAPRYAGLRTQSRWVSTGESVSVDLGVIDTEGKPVVGVPVTARLAQVDWRYMRRRGAGGATRYAWSRQTVDVGRCTAQSASSPVSCKLALNASGSYEITAEVDGRPGGSTSIWAWHDGDDTENTKAFPSRGRTIEIVTDKGRYAPGETAKLLVHSPYPAATALLTTEQGGLLTHKAQRIEGPAAMLEVPLTASHAPYVHATVTLLPIGAKGSAALDYRIGAARLPVSLASARLDVAVKSAKPSFSPGEEAEINIEVKDGGKPEPNAEIALAVVDEGVLRLTNFHPTDPAQALRPGRALSFKLRDTRKELAELYDRSHVAGDGGGEGETLTSTRKNFVETALWRPDVRTDAQGRATVKFRLPDNLTQFRIMAVALDDEGKGAAAEGDFTVKKPVMLVPIVPRFAAVGDRFEAAAMLHNNTDKPMPLTVALRDRSETVTVQAGGHTRVGFPLVAERAAEMRLPFSVKDSGGAPLDAVEAKIPVDAAGLDESPRVEGAFVRSQEIALSVPASVVTRPGRESITVQVGQHLWPELGERLGYLIDYPHGCVEQTTSSTLPLLAAREIFPRIGFTRFGEGELRVKIRAGLERLATMKTSSGGLAYWPGGSDPNVYGTAYAMRAVVLAKKAGIEPPAGLLEGMSSYLEDHALSSSIEPEVQAAIAQSLAELGELPASASDALFERRAKVSVFGAASLALALAALPGQEDRVEALLDAVEAGFSERGDLVTPPGSNDFYYYGSPTRTKAQAAIALRRLRPRSKLLPPLVNELARETGSYTTQSTAYSLLALSEELLGKVGSGAEVRALLDGQPIATSRDLGFGSREIQIPVAALREKKALLKLESSSEDAVGFLVSASWRRASDKPAAEAGAAAGADTAVTTAKGPDVYRIYTDAKGAPVDLARVHAGDVVRVSLLVRLPLSIDRERLGYVAVTDRLPAGFEPVQTDLATVASVPDLDESHPFSSLFRWGGSEASNLELHDDRVNVYFDRIWSDFVAATYLVRASTPGSFVIPPAVAELMYEPNSMGTSETGRLVVQ
jgi:hypothetical protein